MLNNNADLDNGVYNENEEELKKQEEADKAIKVSEQTDDLTGMNEVIVSEATKEDLTEEINFEMVDAEPESLNTSQVIIDEDKVHLMEKNFEYSRDYIIKQIESDALNHCTSTYYLLG